jgi:hypothetical protein
MAATDEGKAIASKRADGEEASAYTPPADDGRPSAANDPLDQYRAILKDPELTTDQKDWLIHRANRRFRNRRRMAYLALSALLAVLTVLVAAALVDGIWGTTIVRQLQNAANLLGVTNALLASIVGAYYGFSSFRPSS